MMYELDETINDIVDSKTNQESEEIVYDLIAIDDPLPNGYVETRTVVYTDKVQRLVRM